MRLVKIGLANVNATVGAVRSNVDRCLRLAHAMAEESVTLAVFPEQVIGAKNLFTDREAATKAKRASLPRKMSGASRLP